MLYRVPQYRDLLVYYTGIMGGGLENRGRGGDRSDRGQK